MRKMTKTQELASWIRKTLGRTAAKYFLQHLGNSRHFRSSFKFAQRKLNELKRLQARRELSHPDAL